jgi:hypothetical protein
MMELRGFGLLILHLLIYIRSYVGGEEIEVEVSGDFGVNHNARSVTFKNRYANAMHVRWTDPSEINVYANI